MESEGGVFLSKEQHREVQRGGVKLGVSKLKEAQCLWTLVGDQKLGHSQGPDLVRSHCPKSLAFILKVH